MELCTIKYYKNNSIVRKLCHTPLICKIEPSEIVVMCISLTSVCRTLPEISVHIPCSHVYESANSKRLLKSYSNDPPRINSEGTTEQWLTLLLWRQRQLLGLGTVVFISPHVSACQELLTSFWIELRNGQIT